MSKKNDIFVSEMMEKIRGNLILPDKAYFFDTSLIIELGKKLYNYRFSKS
ncbi:hypothetical protein LCGC14_1382280 [marine sediment metagenome]|uniref:Uncharacterized protein n=1 Tax=marine sediment metagenome TaxID=412755 RepID=A0A0F9MHR4_9ZZZZ